MIDPRYAASGGRCLSALMALAIATPHLVVAQSLATGAWPGHLQFPDGDSVAVTITVERTTDKTRMGLLATTGNNWGLGDVRESAGRVTFTWAMDRPEPMRCRLSHRTDLHWEGHCDDVVRGADGKFLRLMLTLRRPAEG